MSEGELRAELKANRDSLRNLHAEVTSMKQQMSRQRYHSATAMAPPGMDTIVQGWANIFGEKISEDLSSYMTGAGTGCTRTDATPSSCLWDAIRR